MKAVRKILNFTLLLCLCFSTLNLVQGEEKTKMVENLVALKGDLTELSSVTGTVTLLRDSVIRLTDKENAEYDFIVSENSVLTDTKGFIEADSIKEGDSLTAYYVMPELMIMIYPPQFEAVVLVKKEENNPENVYVGFFDSNLLSENNGLKLNVSEETPLFIKTGEKYTGDIRNKTLIVYYTFQTLSLPPQTSPVKIVVLDTAPKKKLDLAKLSETPLYVNNKIVEGAAAYLNKEGIIMVPLRHIADALGFNLDWDGGQKQVRVGTATVMTIGSKEYTVGFAMPRELDAAPELKDNYTYVPVSFLTDIMNVGYDTGDGVLAFNIIND